MAIASSVEKEIESRVSEWDGVTAEQRRNDRVEFMWHGEDFGHIDTDGSVDLPLSIPVREALVEAGRTHPHPVYTTTGWTTFDVGGEDDIEEAVKLLRLAYVFYVLDASHDDGQAALAESIDLDAELEAFGADEGVRAAMTEMA